MMNGLEIEENLFETKRQNTNPKIDAIIYIDNTKDNDLIQFIINSQQKGFNCLDLAKRNIKEFPLQILDFISLQYLYLEGNQLTQLPNDLFIRLLNLKWLDLRNNHLTSIPSYGLAKHYSLQYLLLSGNHLKTLPFELGKVKTLSALNLDGNPLIHPPFKIVKQGIKSIQQYLRDELHSDSESSSDDDRPQTPEIFPRKSNSQTGFYESIPSNRLPPHLQSCIQFKRISYSAIRPSPPIRSRPQSETRFPQVKTKAITTKNNDFETNVFTTQQQSLMHLKHRDIKSEESDYEEPIIHTPFHIDPHYIQQNLIKYENGRNHSSEDEDIKRTHDRQIQDRIRQITDKMLRRRLEARGSLFQEKRQIRIELRELRKLESDGKAQIDSPFKMKSRKKV